MENRPYVFAMRIYLSDRNEPMANLAILKEGYVVGVDTIKYDDIAAREEYYTNSYTLIWDERVIEDIDCTFSEYVDKCIHRNP